MNGAHTDSRILRGMEAQFRARQTRLDAGEKVIGWKVGFGSPSAMEQLNLDAPLLGFLTDRVVLPSAVSVSVAGWIKPALEPEVAVYLGRDLAGDVDRETASAAIAALGPAFELADVAFPPSDVETILAGDIYNKHVILGEPDPTRAGCVLDGLVGQVSRAGAEVATVTDLQAGTGNYIDIIVHVAGLLTVFGEKLKAGEFVIMGSIVPPIWITEPEEIHYSLDPMETITISLDT